MVNSVKLKIFSVWPKIQPKTTEIIFSPYFPKNLFLLSLTRTPPSHMHCLSQSFTASTHTPSQTERSTSTHHDRDRDHRNCADLRRSRSRRSQSRDRNRRDCDRDLADLARSVDRDRDWRDCDRDLTNHDRDLTEKMWYFLGFICVFRNEWQYVFVW